MYVAPRNLESHLFRTHFVRAAVYNLNQAKRQCKCAADRSTSMSMTINKTFKMQREEVGGMKNSLEEVKGMKDSLKVG